MEERVAVIRTSDRIGFKKCRRRWDWSSHLRGNLEPIRQANPLWMGVGVHFALEDFHNENVYESPRRAFLAYAYACKQHNPNYLPMDWRELTKLSVGMMDYYPIWLRSRDPLKTYVVDGIPQVEVNFKIDIPLDPELLARHGYTSAVYSGTLDRVAIDDDNRLWIVEYKTAKTIQTHFYATDPQVSTYVWACEHVYDLPVAGVIYQQHRKDVPNLPRILKNGSLSCAAQQKTTHRLYRKAIIDHYESVDKAPAKIVDCLNNLAAEENEDYDDFIRRDKIYRNTKTSEAEAQKILLESVDMTNLDLSLYPNPTRDCAHMCPFLTSCVTLDDGGDWEYEMSLDFQKRDPNYDSWRTYLPKPEEFHNIKF